MAAQTGNHKTKIILVLKVIEAKSCRYTAISEIKGIFITISTIQLKAQTMKHCKSDQT